MQVSPRHVFLVKSEAPGYGPMDLAPPVELPSGVRMTTALHAVRRLLQEAGLDSSRYGTLEWNPLGDLIDSRDKVLLKPNWVLDKSLSSRGGLDCLVTHASVIEAVLYYVVKANPKSIVLGDAPLQSCDFEALYKACGLEDLVQRFRRSGHEIQIRDYRLTRMEGLFGEKNRTEPAKDKYCLFDLAEHSYLAPITDNRTEFRVTCYDPDIIGMHHNDRAHQYLIAREAMEADVVINLPKLKTHKKAGVTGALKNMVGINGFKEYLPHHRKGGSRHGGDCYEGRSWLKGYAEDLLDRANRENGSFSAYCRIRLAGVATRLDAAIFGHDLNLEGAWYGNDTVWRMCLDLQRILHYGMVDQRMADAPQRKVITITDAIVAGDGDGPLAPSPVPLGIMTFGTNVAALEWVHCLLMHLDPEKIPLVSHAFSGGPWPLADFSPRDIRVRVHGEELPDVKQVVRFGRPFTPADGWKGHCEMANTRGE